MRGEKVSLVFLVLFLISIPLIPSGSSNGTVHIDGTYKDLWNQTLDASISRPWPYPTVIAVDDISCDGKPDVLLITKNDSLVTLVALCGENGAQLWIYNITGVDPVVNVYPVDDMTCDGKTDLIVTVDEYSLHKTTLIALGGRDGMFLWTETVTSTNYHTVFFYPVADLSCDNKTDILLEIGINNGSTGKTVTAIGLVGKNGTRLWTWTQTTPYQYYTLSIDVIPVDDMTCDGKNDVVIHKYSGYTIQDSCIVLDGTNGVVLWSETYGGGRMDMYTVSDLNGDGKADVILDKGHPHYRNLRARTGDGTVLWDVNVTDGLRNLLRVDDISGDGMIDLIKGIAGGAVALAGNDGSVLWKNNESLNGSSRTYNVGDLSCDGKDDIILSQYQSDIPAAFLVALDGTTGVSLWNYSINLGDWVISNNIVDVVSVADMDCDGKNDILLPINLGKPDYSGYQGLVVALSGMGGEELWNKTITFEYGGIGVLPVDDVTCDGKTDIILSIYDYNFSALTATLKVMALVGWNGTVLWEENVTGGYSNVTLDVYFGGDFSGDGKTDIILALGDLGTQVYEVKVKEGKTGRDVIIFSSNTRLYPAMFFRYQVIRYSDGWPDSFFWEVDKWVRYDLTGENIIDLVVGGGQEVYAVTKLVSSQGGSSGVSQVPLLSSLHLALLAVLMVVVAVVGFLRKK